MPAMHDHRLFAAGQVRKVQGEDRQHEVPMADPEQGAQLIGDLPALPIKWHNRRSGPSLSDIAPTPPNHRDRGRDIP